jgi:hypothetical protein
MRETPLVVAFVKSARGYDKAERDAIVGFGITANDVPQAVGKRSLDDRRIGGKV